MKRVQNSRSEPYSGPDAIGSPYAARPWLRHYDYWVPPHVNYPRRPLYEILSETTIEVPDHPATAFGGAHLTFRDVKHRADLLATALMRTGITRGDRVGIMLPNCPQYLVSAFAILLLGAVVVNVNPIYTARELLGLAQDSGMRLLLTLDHLAPLAVGIRGQTQLERIVITSLAEYSSQSSPPAAIDGTVTLAELMSGVDAVDLSPVPIDPEQDLAVLQYTGGTTGTLKAAMLTHYSIFANVVQMETFWHRSFVRGEDRYLMVIPYFHVYGFTVGLMGGTWLGAQQIMIPKYDVDVVLESIRQYRPTYFPGVPTIFISLLNHPRVTEYGLDSVRGFNSGSAPLPAAVIERFERTIGRPLSQGYGLSEASPVTHSMPKLARRKPTSIGVPLPDTDIKIVDIETGTRDVPIGETGELCIAGPQVMKGYWKEPHETALALRGDRDGRTWLYTGDVASMDEDGFTTIVQRKKDLILVDGFNVYPSEVEGVLCAHPAILDAAVIGTPDLYHGEVVKAFVVLKQGFVSTAADLTMHCARGLADFKVPKQIEIRDSLPRTAVGKVLYRALREEQAKP